MASSTHKRLVELNIYTTTMSHDLMAISWLDKPCHMTYRSNLVAYLSGRELLELYKELVLFVKLKNKQYLTSWVSSQATNACPQNSSANPYKMVYNVTKYQKYDFKIHLT